MRLGVVTVFAIAALAAAGAAAAGGYTFGRVGGNIRPYTVTISPGGLVRTSGAVNVGRKQLTAAQLASLSGVAASVKFATLPQTTNCAGTLPDIAATYVRVGTHTVRVRGNCLPRYARMWKALTAAVHISG